MTDLDLDKLEAGIRGRYRALSVRDDDATILALIAELREARQVLAALRRAVTTDLKRNMDETLQRQTELDLAIERAAKAERERDEERERGDSYAKIGALLQRRIAEIHTAICGEANVSPREHHESIMEVLRGGDGLGPWNVLEADLAKKIAGDPTIVYGYGGQTARVVGEEAEQKERAHRTLCADSAPYLMRKAIAWMVAAEAERDELDAECSRRLVRALTAEKELSEIRDMVWCYLDEPSETSSVKDAIRALIEDRGELVAEVIEARAARTVPKDVRSTIVNALRLWRRYWAGRVEGTNEKWDAATEWLRSLDTEPQQTPPTPSPQDDGPSMDRVPPSGGDSGGLRADVARCEVCDWPIAESIEKGCVVGNCSYRPEYGSDEHRRIRARRAELEEAKKTVEPDRYAEGWAAAIEAAVMALASMTSEVGLDDALRSLKPGGAPAHPCPSCHGTGGAGHYACEDCDGTGKAGKR